MMGTKLTCPIFLVFLLGFVLMPVSNAAQWNIDFQGDGNHNNTYGQTGPVDYTEWGVYWNIFEVPALSAPWPTNYATNPSMDLADDEGSFGVGKSSLVKFSIVGDAYGWAGGAGADPLTGDYLIILNSFGVTNDPLTWRITGLAPSTTYRLTYYLANVFGRGINFVANGVETTVSVPGLSVASALVTTGWGRIITGTADSEGYAEGNWSALTISTVAATATNPHPANGATDVSLDVVLGWIPGDYAVSHDVYFGTSSPPAFIGNLAASSYDPGTLEPGTTYYWKINEVEADGTTKHTGDVWSFTTQHIFVPVPIVPVPIRCEALNPYPADGATDVALDGVVRWTPYLGAVSHDVYFGTDRDAVANANPGSPEYKGQLAFDANDYSPGGLEPGTTYYWKIDEAVPTVGELWRVSDGVVWSFTTADLTPSIVDDFEGYDYFTNRISQTWKDGYGYADFELVYPGNGTGSMVDISTDVIREGAQSMRFSYDNSGSYRKAFYSETERTFDTPQDWTRNGVKALSLWFRGDPNNDSEPIYVAVADNAGAHAIVYHDALDAVRIDTWTEWFIPLQDFAGVNLASIRKMYIGFGDRYNPQLGGTGILYFDDIRLSESIEEPEEKESWGPTEEELATPPVPEEGYVYIGYEVLLDFHIAESTLPKDYFGSPGEILVIRGHRIYRDGEVVREVYVFHVFVPKEDKDEKE